MQGMMKGTAATFRNFINPRRLMRGTAVTVADCGVSREDLLAVLRRTELFCNMPDGLADNLLETMAGRRMRAGAVVFREGARGDSLLLKAAGTARVTQLRAGLPHSRVLATLPDPAVLGQEAFVGVEKRAVTVRMLTAGTVFHIRRGVFADLVANSHVRWCEADTVVLDAEHLLWIGDASTRPRALTGVPCLTIDRIKHYVREAPVEQTTYCCARDDTLAAFASFLLAQRGVDAVAVRQGRKLSVVSKGANREAM